MRIAIVIPTCNDSLYVAECLKSISAGAKGYVQSVIVVDAGSKDGTLSVVRSTGLHQNINGGKTANGIAKEVGNFNVVALLNQYRLKDPGIDEDDIDKIVTRHWCCSNKNFERVKRAACDF